MSVLEQRIFTGGMDSDSEQRLVAQGDYRRAINCRIASGDNDDAGSVPNVKGNTLVSYTLPSGINKCIGAYDDKTNKKVYYFVWNNSGKHSILEYNYAIGTIAKVLENSLLNFDRSYLITGVKAIEGLLYWTDDKNEPRKINIEKAKKHSQGNYTDGYPNPLTEEYILQVKRPPHCQPDVAYGSDGTKNINYLENKLFQFKAQFVYDDNEHSRWSAISVVPFPTLTCNQSIVTGQNNFIGVTVETGSPIVTRIRIAAREGNTGDFFLIADLTKSDLGISNNSIYTYQFYNEKAYTFLEVNESNALYDYVPLLSKSLEIIEGERVVHGNILEGYDNVPVDARLELGFKDAPQLATHSISFNIQIVNFFVATPPEYAAFQPIHDLQDGNGPVFGGFADLDIENDVGTDYGQKIPLGGFPACLLGTRHYGVSEQVIGNNPGIQSNGIYNSTSTGNNRSLIRDEIEGGRVYSRVTIPNVPPGKYVLALASHLTTQADLDSGSLAYQKTSTNVISICGTGKTQAVIEVLSNGDVVLGSTTYAGGQLPTTFVADLTDPRALSSSIAITGYVTDHDDSTLSGANLVNDTRIELAEVSFDWNGYNWWLTWNPGVLFSAFILQTLGNWQNRKTYTDHNGYFFYAQHNNILNGVLDVDNIKSLSVSLNPNKYDMSGNPWSAPSGAEMKQGVFRGTSDMSSVRTKLEGFVTYNNLPISGVNVISTRGRTVETDQFGAFSIIVYGDTIANINDRKDYLIYVMRDDCVATFGTQEDYYSIILSSSPSGQSNFSSPYTGSYNLTTKVQVAGSTITSLIGNTSESGLKRGGVYQYGIVYYDHSNRSTLTNTQDELYTTQLNAPAPRWGLKLEIPWYTELNSSGQPIGGSIPEVSWSVFNQPPIQATHWQWVRTKNSAINNYLQFTAKSVIYTDDSRAVTSFATATKLGIEIANLADYNNLHNDSALSYDYSKGGRIRIKYDSAGNLLNQYIDLKIRDYDPAGKIYVDNVISIGQLSAGFLFEVYEPKLQADEEVYYEFGERYEVGNPGTSSRYHKGKSQDQFTWNFTDNFFDNGFVGFTSSTPHNIPVGATIYVQQSVGYVHAGYEGYATVTAVTSTTLTTDKAWLGSTPVNPGIIIAPAMGKFTGGDTYYRLRNIPYSGGTRLWYIEDANFSDFFASKVEDIGRPNRVDKDFAQIRRPTIIYYSERYIPETKINGLSTYYDLNFETYDRTYGSIQKLYSDNKRLEVYQELKIGAIPINEEVWYDANGNQTVGLSAKVLNNFVPFAGDYGISKNPESFAVFGNRRYFTDLNRGVVLRLSLDGLTPISGRHIKMHNYFTDKFNIYVQNNIQPFIYGVYDKKFDEYIISFEAYDSTSTDTGDTGGSEDDLIGGRTAIRQIPGETVAFNEDNNRWETFYSYLPDFMSSADTNIVTWKSGALYTHNTNPLYNNFYGIQHDREIWVVSNVGESANESVKKIYKGMTIDPAYPWEIYEITTPGWSNYTSGQLSELASTDFTDKEGEYYADFLRDKNTPNVALPLFEGDTMRGNTMLIKMRDSSTTYTKLFKVKFYVTPSERTNK